MNDDIKLFMGIIGLIALSILQTVVVLVAWDIGGIPVAVVACAVCNIVIAVEQERNRIRNEQ